MPLRLSTQISRRPLTVVTLFYGLGFLLPALLLRALWFGDMFYTGDLGRPPDVAILAALAGTAVVLAATPWMMRFEWARRISTMIHQVFGDLNLAQSAWLGIVSGLCEELLFRGALQPITGLIPAAILFALAHMIGAWWIFAFVVGLALGVLYDWSGSLWPCVLAHASLNAINLYRMGR